MNEEKKVPFKWEYGEETISLQLGMYANNQRLYIGMITHTEDGAEPFADMTVNLSGYSLDPGEAFISGDISYSSPQSQHRPDGKTYDADSSFRCPTYKSMYGECTMHYIKSSTLDKLVDEAVRKIARYVLRNEQAFLEQVRVLTSADQKHTQSEDKKELVNIKKRIAELDNYIKRLYEGNA